MNKWNIFNFEEVISDDTRNGTKIKKENYLEQGLHPIIDQGQHQIAGYRNSDDGLYKDIPVIIFGDHTRVIKYIDAPFFLGADGVKLLKSKKDNVDYKYLYYFFVKNKVLDTGYNRHFKWLKELYIPLPPLEIQKQIAKTLDAAAELLIMHKQQLAELDNLIKSTFYDMFGDPVANEKGWDKKRLGNECEIVTGNTPSRKDVENFGSYIEWIKSDNINIDGMYLSKAVEYLSEKGFCACRYVDTPSVLMTCIAGSIKCIGNIGISDRKVAFNQQINAVVPNENNVFFLYSLFMFTKEYIQSTINMSLKGILSKGKLSELEFIFPPIEIQNRFASMVTKTEAQKSLVKKAIDETQYLFDSLMNEYFE